MAVGADVDVRVTRVAGRLPPGRRAAVATAAQELVTGYVASAWTGRDGASYPGFTPQAREAARADQDRVSGAGFDEVAVRRLRAAVSVTATEGAAVGATARLAVELDLVAAGVRRPARLTGRLLLTPTDAGWRVFGYDFVLPEGGTR